MVIIKRWETCIKKAHMQGFWNTFQAWKEPIFFLLIASHKATPVDLWHHLFLQHWAVKKRGPTKCPPFESWFSVPLDFLPILLPVRRGRNPEPPDQRWRNCGPTDTAGHQLQPVNKPLRCYNENVINILQCYKNSLNSKLMTLQLKSNSPQTTSPTPHCFIR